METKNQKPKTHCKDDCCESHREKILGTLEEVSTALDDPNKGDNEQGHQLHHRPDLTHPAEIITAHYGGST